MRRPDLGERLQLLNLALAKVADTDSLGLALLVQSFESSPHGLSALGTRARAVDQEQVDIAALVDLVHTLDE